MTCYTITISKDNFDKSLQFLSFLDTTYDYLYKEFYFTYDVHVERNNDITSDEISFYVRTDHDFLNKEITEHFFKENDIRS